MIGENMRRLRKTVSVGAKVATGGHRKRTIDDSGNSCSSNH